MVDGENHIGMAARKYDLVQFAPLQKVVKSTIVSCTTIAGTRAGRITSLLVNRFNVIDLFIQATHVVLVE